MRKKAKKRQNNIVTKRVKLMGRTITIIAPRTPKAAATRKRVTRKTRKKVTRRRVVKRRAKRRARR